MEINELKVIMVEIEKSKTIIAKERDKLRLIYDELEGYIGCFDDGINELEDSLIDIGMAIDNISMVV